MYWLKVIRATIIVCLLGHIRDAMGFFTQMGAIHHVTIFEIGQFKIDSPSVAFGVMKAPIYLVKYDYGAFNFWQCNMKRKAIVHLTVTLLQADQQESLQRYLFQNNMLHTIKSAQIETALINHQQMTIACTTSFTVVQPVVSDRNWSYYQSWNCSTNRTTIRMVAQPIARPVARLHTIHRA